MQLHSAQQRDILRKIGIEVWKLRTSEIAVTQPRTVAANCDEHKNALPQPTADKTVSDTPELAQPANSDSAPELAPEPIAAAPTHQSASDSTNGEPIQNLELLERTVSACEKCALHSSRTHTVFGCGSPTADWFFVGEAPGENEDLQGQPFVGRAGKLLDMMIAAVGSSREQVFIANVLKCRPPNNRDPLPAEIEMCEPYLHQQLALIKPKVIVALGRISAQALLKTNQALGKLRGTTYPYGPDQIPLVVTYHPAYLLRSPGQKAAAWEDLWQARGIVGTP